MIQLIWSHKNTNIIMDHRYAKKCYKMLKCYDGAGGINWVSAIRQLLCNYNGFGYVWENEGTIPGVIFTKTERSILTTVACTNQCKL